MSKTEDVEPIKETVSFIKKAWERVNKPVNLLVIGLFVGAFTILGLRVILVQDHATHYHADFALYIDGQQDKFDNFTFYEEVQSCNTQDENNPRHRAHMHGNEAGSVHIHDDGVTWGAFFANIGYGLTNKSIQTDKGVFVDGADGKKLTFILNGQKTSSIANKLIGDKDMLLIDYGDGSNTQKEYDSIPRLAAQHDVTPDPASCSGSSKLTFADRLKRAIDFSK